MKRDVLVLNLMVATGDYAVINEVRTAIRFSLHLNINPPSLFRTT